MLSVLAQEHPHCRYRYVPLGGKDVVEMRNEVRKGTEFPLELQIIEKEIEEKRLCKELEGTRNRTLILWVSLSMAAVFVVGAAVMGIIEGQFGALQHVYNAIAPVYFGLCGYYYGKKQMGEKR